MMPWPSTKSGSGCSPSASERDAVANSASRICATPYSGRACRMHAAAAATIGVLRLVPLTYDTLFANVECTVATETPHAPTSGLRRPSAVGPLEEKPATLPPRSCAAQLITSSASAGVTSVLVTGSASWPSLPAEVRQMSPLAVAVFTATAHTVDAPSRSACVCQSM